MHCRMQTLFCHDTILPFYDAHIATIFKYLQYRFMCDSCVYNIPYLVECLQHRMQTAVRKYIYIYMYIFVHVFVNYIYLVLCIFVFIYTTSHHMMQYCNELCSYGTTSYNVDECGEPWCYTVLQILVHIVFIIFAPRCLPSINKMNG